MVVTSRIKAINIADSREERLLQVNAAARPSSTRKPESKATKTGKFRQIQKAKRPLLPNPLVGGMCERKPGRRSEPGFFVSLQRRNSPVSGEFPKAFLACKIGTEIVRKLNILMS